MMTSRTNLAFKNVFVTTLVNILTFPLQFINRYYMIHYLGITYLGITSLYANILSVLSLADLGIGTAIVFLLYKPLAQNNKRKIAILMHYYKKIYRFICFIILTLGLLFIPFLHYLLHSYVNYPHVYLIFIIYLLGTSSSYLFSYNQSLLYADQKNRIYSWYNLAVCYIMIILQIITVRIFKDPVLYATLFVFTGFITNIFVSLYVKKIYHLKYPKKGKLSLIERKELKANVFGNMIMRISGVIVTGTDNILLSVFTTVIQVGLYANYTTITNIISQLMTQIISASTGSIGNFIVSKSSKESKQLFYNLQYINFLILNLAVLGILFLSKDVITLWLGKKYVLSPLNTILIAISFFVMNYRMLGWSFIAIYGLSKYMKLFSISELCVNLIASFAFLKFFHLGVTGVILGTILSTISTVSWQDPYIIFHHGFRSSIRGYFQQYTLNILIFLTELFVLSGLNSYFEKSIKSSLLHFIIMLILILIVGVILPNIFYFKKREQKYLIFLLKKCIGIYFKQNNL